MYKAGHLFEAIYLTSLLGRMSKTNGTQARYNRKRILFFSIKQTNYPVTKYWRCGV